MKQKLFYLNIANFNIYDHFVKITNTVTDRRKGNEFKYLSVWQSGQKYQNLFR